MPRPGPVLIVSDDPVLRDLLRDLLVKQRLRAEEAETPDAALARCRERPAGLLLVDAIVREQEVLTFLSRLAVVQADGSCPPVVVLTGSAPSQELVMHELVRETIGAPFATPALLEAVQRHVGSAGSSRTRLRAARESSAEKSTASGEER